MKHTNELDIVAAAEAVVAAHPRLQGLKGSRRKAILALRIAVNARRAKAGRRPL